MARTAGTVEKTDDEKFAIGLTYKAPDMETGETFSASTASVTPAGLTLDGSVVTDDAAKTAEQMVSGGIDTAIRDIADDHAAKTNKIKKSVPKNVPPSIEPKAMGSVWNMRPGPAPGSSPFANTIGKIAIPANNATAVSANATIMEVFAIDASCGM